MEPFEKNMMDSLNVAGYSDSTKRSYLFAIRRLHKFFDCLCPSLLGEHHIKKYLIDLAENYSRSSSYMHLVSMKFYYTNVVGTPFKCLDIKWKRSKARMPTVLSKDQISTLLKNTQVARYRMAFTLCYGAGLRLSEALGLTAMDIDSKRMVIRVLDSKNNQSRQVPLSNRVLSELRIYWKNHRWVSPHPWVFPSPESDCHLSHCGITRAFKLIAARSNCPNAATIHSLRHSYATHLLEDGTDLRIIQAILGHADIRSTIIYLKVSTKLISQVKSPLDSL